MFKSRDHFFNWPRFLCMAYVVGMPVGKFFGIKWNEPLDPNRPHQSIYNGCGDTCFDPSIISNACSMTTKVNLSSLDIICDASKIWFWIERYPIECLEAVGEIYKANELWWTRFWLRMLYILFPVFYFLSGLMASIVLEVLISLLVKCVTSWKRKPRVEARRDNAGIKTPLLFPAVTVAFLALISLPNLTAAYPCMTLYPPYDRSFTNANGSVYGVIHGWLSDCYSEIYTCGESCMTSSVNGEVTCISISCTRPQPFKVPADFVNSVAWRVESCGFRLVDAVPGVVDKRVPNPKIEESFWVQIAVNAFNNTDTGEEKLDGGVKCLYEMI